MHAILVLTAFLTACGRVSFDPVGDARVDAATENDWPTLAGEWTWMSGSRFKDQPGIYGSLDVPAATNHPGARDNGAMWTVGEELWLFGGVGFGAGALQGLADLWSFDTATNAWTWRGGSPLGSTPVFGTRGVPDAANLPPARNDPSHWQTADSLWLYGGVDLTTGSNYRSDVWRYDMGLRQWSWEAGSQVSDEVAVHGTQGIAAPTNTPGARNGVPAWGDADGFWIYGGAVVTGPMMSNEYGDVWRYDYATSQWTWYAGPSAFSPPTVFGTRGIPSPANQPRRGEGCAVGDATAGELWMIARADIWRFHIASREWTWIAGPGGDDAPPVYGTRDETSPSSRPAARYAATCWRDVRGNIWFFGGIGEDANGIVGQLNDMWVYQPDVDAWTWIAGASSSLQVPTYELQGTSSTETTPGSRYTGPHWVGPDGMLWMMGGDYALDIDGTQGMMNDLWRLAPSR